MGMGNILVRRVYNNDRGNNDERTIGGMNANSKC